MTEKQIKFIEDVAKYVVKYAPSYGIKCHSAVIAQAILESGWGSSEIAKRGHNYFGMKTGSSWKGKSISMRTSEEYHRGHYTKITAKFRAYDSMEEGIKGYFEFVSMSRYSNLKGVKDPETYLKRIKDDGYATNHDYVENVMRCVNNYGLRKYDKVSDSKSKVVKTRRAYVDQAKKWLGTNEGDGSHKKVCDIYNAFSPLPNGRKIKYSEGWCTTFVSVCAIQLGYTDIIPIEISCRRMISRFQKIGRWHENENYVPKPGDIIFFDWDDNGRGDCKGSADHVGLVEYVDGGYVHTIEGNSKDMVRRKKYPINGKLIRGYGLPKYDASDSIEVAVERVLAGYYGNGEVRKKKLAEDGYDYEEVQRAVNERLG